MTHPTATPLRAPPRARDHDARELLYRCTLATASHPESCEQHAHHWDAVDAYFTCLMACDLLDHACSSTCVDDLRGADPGAAEPDEAELDDAEPCLPVPGLAGGTARASGPSATAARR
ncbi:hypothetical protein [Cyanobium sp. NIES-981]|uniref:hypothetical protein n=1 Tax=Cyanobium sp. NIES-981 TaxID=1851505 RepID=UPI0007DDDA80|nr:hypothetical protein [Cyanobium sp. NIES-981]SBO42253.1 protein of unknown function [Cyanobium sp. NIES-981]